LFSQESHLHKYLVSNWFVFEGFSLTGKEVITNWLIHYTRMPIKNVCPSKKKLTLSKNILTEGKKLELKCNLANIMSVQGRSQKWLADKVGVSMATISQIKQEKRLPTLPVAFRIAKVLEVKIEDLWEEIK
jgi:DNA-binding XRE family transcriptional regulator